MKIDFKNYISINLLDERPLKKNPIGLTALPTQKISTLVNPIGQFKKNIDYYKIIFSLFISSICSSNVFIGLEIATRPERTNSNKPNGFNSVNNNS